MSVIDGLHRDFSDILTFLYKSGEISWGSVADENFRKVLLVAAASHFEKTSEEIYNLYSDAKAFVEWFPDELNRFTE